MWRTLARTGTVLNHSSKRRCFLKKKVFLSTFLNVQLYLNMYLPYLSSIHIKYDKNDFSELFTHQY